MQNLIDILLFLFGIIAACILWVMIYDTTHFRITKHKISDRRIKKNCRAVVLADLHNHSYGRDNELLISAIRGEQPDLILIAGDLMTAKPKADFTPAVKLLEKLAKEFPICYGVGNHEHRTELYPETYGDMGERYRNVIGEAGVTYLENQKRAFDEYGICVTGSVIGKEFYKRLRTKEMNRQYLDGILGKPDRNVYNILLAHNPDYFKTYAEWGADLTLSGHVHGGVVRVPFWGRGVVSPAVKFFPKYDGGLFTEGDKKMILSRGLGCHTIPFRLFNPGDLIVIDFCPE